MGQHTGIRVQQLASGAWQGWAYDPQTKGYKKRSEKDWNKSQARTWATEQHQLYSLGQAQLHRAGIHSAESLWRQFVAHKGGDMKLARSTMSGYQTIERLGFLEAVPDPTSVAAGKQAQAWLSGLDLAPSTRSTYRMKVTAFGTWLRRRAKVMRYNPFDELVTEKVPKKLKPQFSVEELRTVVQADDHMRLMLALQVYAGLRAQEASFIRWEDIDWKGNTLLVTPASGADVKGGKERRVTLQWELRCLLALAPGPHEGRIGDGRHRNHAPIFKWFLKRHKIPHAGRTPHSLRHAYAGLSTATGVPSLEVALEMGHEDLETTANYSQLSRTYKADTHGWRPGQFQLLNGWTTKLVWTEVDEPIVILDDEVDNAREASKSEVAA